MQGVKRIFAVATAVTVIASTMVVGVLPAVADSVAEEQQFVDLINAERTAVGAKPLVVVGELVVGAREQAAKMAAAGEIFHNQDLGSLIDGWALLGENVGMGGDVESLHRAFMNSKGHRDNLLNPAYDGIGVGVVWADGLPYVSEVFIDSTEPLSQYRPPFLDDDGSVFEDDIITLFGMGVTKGCAPDRYCPDRPVTRGEMATMLVRAFELTGPVGDSFVDDNGSPHQAAIEVLAANDITKGCAPNRFCPDRSITRAEMAVFLSRILDLPAVAPVGFVDIVSSEASEAIDSLAVAGITKGCSPNSFCPSDEVTRGQLASFLVRALRS